MSSQMLLTFIPILSLFVSAGSLLFTIRIYAKRRTFENENHFFNYKLEQYGNIVYHASELLELLYKNLYDIKYMMKYKCFRNPHSKKILLCLRLDRP
jgi:hypothetical protein